MSNGDAKRSSDQVRARRQVMAAAARATLAELETAVTALGSPVHQLIRAPEIGLAMVRGRIGGDGSPFNIGEATVTRAAVRLETGEFGLSYLLGRDPDRARCAAILDALVQRGDAVHAQFVEPVSRRLAAEDATVAARTAATRVEFFTMVRGDG
jgi:alpha-D-ribose 1-methylphosphonate 5-triphosphate synthase subunit PhnG